MVGIRGDTGNGDGVAMTTALFQSNLPAAQLCVALRNLHAHACVWVCEKAPIFKVVHGAFVHVAVCKSGLDRGLLCSFARRIFFMLLYEKLAVCMYPLLMHVFLVPGNAEHMQPFTAQVYSEVTFHSTGLSEQENGKLVVVFLSPLALL